MPGLDTLISHRFRGFAPYENTIRGLNAALDFGVLNLEFDIRVAKCGTPMIYHDEYAKTADGSKPHIKDIMAGEFKALGGTFAHMPTADALFAAAAKHTNKSARFLIDIKDAGFEEEILSLARANSLAGRIVWVSWLPDVLYRLHEIDPKTPLCLSHWCKRPGQVTIAKHKIYAAKDGIIPRDKPGYTHGKRMGWYVDGPLRGELRDLIKKTGGGVCVPQNMISRELVKDYHADGIKVSTFSYTHWNKINAHKDRFNIDTYFIDNKDVFDKISDNL